MSTSWMYRRCLAVFPLLLLLMTTPPNIFAQVDSGTISGTVSDTTNAPIAGATVVITNQGTAISQTRTTDKNGFYSVEGLTTAAYTIAISRDGFQSNVTHNLQLAPGQSRANNVSLDIGRVTSQVNVEADAVQVNTETSESGGTITSEQISNLQMNGRNFQTLAISVPGVASTQGASQTIGAGTYLIVNGASDEYSTYTVDGVYDMNSGSLGQVNVTPIVDGIAEFQVLKDNYSAKYSYAGSGQIVTETKSGTNTFHGSAWDYLRNDGFDARNYFSTSNQHLRQNIYGWTLGGPVIIPNFYNESREKTFFFAAEQWYNIDAGQIIRGALFPQAMRNGDFSESPTLSGPLTLDAHSMALLASEGKTNCILGPTTLNTACFDPAAVSIMNAYWPLPNNLPAGFLNYINQGNATTREFDNQYRIDQYITQNEVLTGRLEYEPVTNVDPNLDLNPAPTIRLRNYTPAFNALIRMSSTITPAFLNTFGVAETYDKPRIDPIGGTLPAGTTIVQAFPGADPLKRIPNINLSGGWSGNGVDNYPITASDGEGILQDDVVWTKGNHVLQFGAIYMFGIKRQNVFTFPQGTFSFTGIHTGDPAADYLLGLDSTYSQSSSQRLGSFHYRQGESYFQDDWKATHNLVINAGIHWTYFSNDTVSGSQVTSFDPALYNASEAPVVNVNGSLMLNGNNVPINQSGVPANLLNGIIYAGTNGVLNGFFPTQKTLFQPRVGFAYNIGGYGKSSIRGGYGIGYTRVPLQAIYDAYGQNPPYNSSANVLNSLLSDGTAGTSAAPTTQTLNVEPSSFTPPQIQSYSLTFERQLAPSMIATAAYAGSQSRHLETMGGSAYDINFPTPVLTPSTTGCLPATQAPSASYDFDPCINASIASPDYTRPYKGYSSMGSVFDEGTANYNSLQSSFIYKTSNAQVNVAYTYSKTLATLGPHYAGANYSVGSSFQNPRDVKAEYGPPAYDFTHDLTTTWVYQIPFFQHGNRTVKGLFGNWTFAGLGLFQSGFALSPSLSTDSNGEAMRPDQVAPITTPHSLQQWFSTSSFRQPAYGFFGDASNGSIRGPHQIAVNTALYKTVPIVGRFQVQFRAEAFNVANHPTFSGVDTGVGSATYGQVNSAGDPRILEFALKLMF